MSQGRTHQLEESLRSIAISCRNHQMVDDAWAKHLGYPDAVAQLKSAMSSIASLCDTALEPQPSATLDADTRIEQAIGALSIALREPGLLSPDPTVATMLLTIIQQAARRAIADAFARED